MNNAAAPLRFASRPSAIYDSAIAMHTVTLSRRFQVVIPKAVREAMSLKPGAKLRVAQCGERVELIPVRRARELRGLLRGMDTTVPRAGDRL